MLHLFRKAFLIISFLAALSGCNGNGHCNSKCPVEFSPQASISFTENHFKSEGFGSIQATDSYRMATSDGPYSDIIASSSIDSPVAINGLLERPMGDIATLMFWFKPPREFKSSIANDSVSQRLIDIENMCSVYFHSKDPIDNCVSIGLRWDDNIKGVDQIRILLPELPAKWIHLAFVWDSEQGLLNAYLNGTPLRAPGTKVTPWKILSASKINVNIAKMPLADFKLFNHSLTHRQIKMILRDEHQGTFDEQLGMKDLGSLNIEPFKGKLIYNNKLHTSGDVANWTIEGPGNLQFSDEWMQMSSKEPDAPNPYGHFVLWCDRDFPADFVAEWEYKLESEYGLSIIFLCAKSVNSQSIFAPELNERTGVYKQYVKGDINSYGISYQANAKFSPGRRTSNLRKNKGFYLAANGPVGIDPDSRKWHKITLVKNGPHIQMAVDQRKIIDFTDDPENLGPVLVEGKMGFRQMRWTVAKYRNFKVYDLAK